MLVVTDTVMELTDCGSSVGYSMYVMAPDGVVFTHVENWRVIILLDRCCRRRSRSKLRDPDQMNAECERDNAR